MTHNFQYVDTDSAWLAVLSDLKKVKYLALDIESNGYHCYPEQICLIQLAFNQKVVIVDPLKLSQWQEFKCILEDKSITKIFHSCDNDLRAFQRDFQIKIINIFDTAIAAKFLGSTHLGLGNVLQEYLSIHLPKQKKLQRQNWSLRPLDQTSLDYAVSDVAYLKQLKSHLEKKLIELDRLFWVQEECRLMENILYKPPAPSEELFWQVKGVGSLTDKQRRLLQACCIFRESFAREVNQPPFRLLSDKALLEMITRPRQKLHAIKGLGQVIRFKKMSELLNVLKVARLQTGIPLTEHPPKTSSKRIKKNKVFFHILRDWRETKGKQNGLDPSVIWPMSALEYLSSHPDSFNQILNWKDIRAWQKQAFQQQLALVVHQWRQLQQEK